MINPLIQSLGMLEHLTRVPVKPWGSSREALNWEIQFSYIQYISYVVFIDFIQPPDFEFVIKLSFRFDTVSPTLLYTILGDIGMV